MAVKDVISPFAFLCAEFLGYTVFLLAWIVVSFAFLRGWLDILSLFQAMPDRHRRANLLIFPTPAVRRVGRG
jgi:hypothetical protein